MDCFFGVNETSVPQDKCSGFGVADVIKFIEMTQLVF